MLYQDVHQDQVALLNRRQVVARCDQHLVAPLVQGTSPSPEEADRRYPLLASGIDRAHQVRGCTTGRQHHEHVPGSADALDLPGKDLLIPVVVRDGGQRGGVGVKCDRGEGVTLTGGNEASDQFAGQMLCLGCRAPIARGEQLAPGAERPRESIPRPLEVVRPVR